MDDAFTVGPTGSCTSTRAASSRSRTAHSPPRRDSRACRVVETGGTLFPGLIELHNHLSYNALPLWSPVPKRFEHRDQWSVHKDYRPMISGPMTVIGEYRDATGQSALLPALVRYVECKCLLGGVTTSQGVMLASNAGIQRFYRGLVRNVEQTDDPVLPEAQGRIADVDAKDARKFLARLKKEDSCFLLHLSEGVTDPAGPTPSRGGTSSRWRSRRASGRSTTCSPASTPRACCPKTSTCSRGSSASIVWSPLSNLLLYGGTARVDAARAAGVTIGLGSDWSPTGSKNLLGELKVAWLYSQHALNGLLSARDLVAMATRDAARILKWEGRLGTLGAGAARRPPRDRRRGGRPLRGARPREGDGHPPRDDQRRRALRRARADGAARAGRPDGERGRPIAAALPEAGDGRPGRGAGVAAARPPPRLRDALLDIAKLAKQAEKAKPAAAKKRALDAPAHPVWSLALDEIQDRGVDLRPRLPFRGPRDFTGPKRAVARGRQGGAAASTILKPIALDPLTVADDEDFLDAIEEQPNVPAPIKNGLRGLY